MNVEALANEVLPCLERIIQFSLINNLNVHTSIGGKYGELWVASELWRYKPRLAKERYDVKGVEKRGSCDIILEKTSKKLEVKWGMLHHRKNDEFVKKVREGVPYWGLGFSGGTQFTKGKFDYCILLAAEKDGAHPQHTFVIKVDDMTESSMGGKRKGAFGKENFYIEFSDNEDYYCKRSWYPYGPTPLEKLLFEQKREYKKRWKRLKENGELE